MSVPNHHIHISRKHAKTGVDMNPENILFKYLATWRKMANNTFTFPIALVLWPLAFVTDSARIIAKSIRPKEEKIDKP
jgi:hypothetical protein